MAFVQLEKISLAFADRDLFKQISLPLKTGDRLALTGSNGSGKTTLMKILAGLQDADSGQVNASGNCLITYLPQTGLVHEGATLREGAEKAFERFHRMTTELDRIGTRLEEGNVTEGETASLLEQHHELHGSLVNGGYYNRSESVDRVLTGLGFSRDDFSKGTWRYLIESREM